MTNTILFKNESDITDQWVDYLEGQVLSLSEKDEFNIENYADGDIFNPIVSAYLEQDDLDIFFDEEENEVFTLNHREKRSFNKLSLKRRKRFGNLKRKIKKVFCEIANAIKEFDLKDILKKVLIGLLPVFATGIPALILPLVLAIVAAYVAKGYTAVCGI